MTVIATAVRHLIAAGVTGNALVTAIEEMEIAISQQQPVKVRSANAVRQERYRDRRDVSASEWDILRFEVFERDEFTCQYCGATDDLACDHIIPLILGGRSTPDNLTTACRPCNGGKSGMSLEEWQS